MKYRSPAIGMMAMSLIGLGCAASKPEGHHKEEEENEVKISVDQIPAAAKATLDREAEGGALTEAEKETDEGKTVYEATTTIGGKEYEIKVAEDGTLLKKKLEKKEADEDKEKHEGDKK